MEAHYFDAEKRASRGMGKGFLTFSLVASLIVGLIVSFGVFKYFTYDSLSPFQKFYFGQFSYSFVNQIRASRKGDYRFLTYQAIDPKSKKKESYFCLEEQLSANADENGSVRIDARGLPMFSIKPEVSFEKDSFLFNPDKVEHGRAYDFFTNRVYHAKFPEIFYLPGGGGIFAFLMLFIVCCALRQKSLKKVLAGKYERGTQMLSPRQYAAAMRKEADGVGISVFTIE